MRSINEPTHCGKPHFSLNPLATSLSSSPVGNEIYKGTSFCIMAAQVSCTTTHTVDLEILNKQAIVQYSAVVARTHSVIATCRSIFSGFPNLVVSFSNKCLSCLLLQQVFELITKTKMCHNLF